MIRFILVAFVASFIAVFSINKSIAKTLDIPVSNYPIECDEIFSCPSSLLPRVSFWVEVFSRWETTTAIFHDKDNPNRVYSTVYRKEGCRRSRRGDAVDRERKRLVKSLKFTASKIASNKKLTASQAQLQSLFEGLPSSEIRAAAGRVRCQSGNRDRMAEALTQYQLYQPTILDALESQNLSLELQYLPFVESAFNPEALSHVGAAGLWQIMPATARTLGLTVNSVVDERYDPRRATYAATKYFRDSVDRLSRTAFENGNTVTAKDLNPFVVTSYNYGVVGMQRAIRQVGLDYERLLLEYKSPNFQTAVKNFYASFLAARYVAKNTEHFFGSLEVDRQNQIYSFSTVSLPRATSAKRLSKELEIDKQLLDSLNPSLTKIVWKDKALIPKGFELKLPYQESGWELAIDELQRLPAEFARPGFLWHRVRSGESACQIAEKYNASCRALFKMNRLNKRGTIYAGKKLKVPTNNGGIGVSSNVSSWTVSNNAPGVDPTNSYKIVAGDTACVIARRYKMKCAEFMAINGFTRRSLLQIGQNVIIASSNAWHTVTRGQTPCAIADSYRVACVELLNTNKLSRNSIIHIGQKLRIPGRG